MQSINFNKWLSAYGIVILSTIVLSCHKETVVTESKLDLLTGKKWQLTNLYHQEVGDNTIVDLRSAYFKDCESDDTYHFTKDHVFFRRDSTNSCGTSTQFGLYGTANWSVDSSFFKINLSSFRNYEYIMEITTLTTNTLELTHRVLDYFSKPVIFTYRFQSLP